MVDSSFFWGYIVTQIPGGFLAARYPANRVFGSAIATSAFLNMLLPIAAKGSFQYVMALRILQGLVEVGVVQHFVVFSLLFLFLIQTLSFSCTLLGDYSERARYPCKSMGGHKLTQVGLCE